MRSVMAKKELQEPKPKSKTRSFLLSPEGMEKNELLQQYNGSAQVSTCSLLLPDLNIVMPLTPSR